MFNTADFSQTIHSLFSKFKELPILIRVMLVVNGGGLSLAGLGIIWILLRVNPMPARLSRGAVTDVRSVTVEPASPAAELGQIWIDVSGAVKAPGLYQLQAGDRIAQALDKAGGFSDEADPEYFLEKLNLAAKLKDGEKIFIPVKVVTLQTSSSSAQVAQGQTTSSATSSSDGISINGASLDELDTLPNIGPKRAQAIIDGRPYGSLNELVERDILSESLFLDIQSNLTL